MEEKESKKKGKKGKKEEGKEEGKEEEQKESIAKDLKEDWLALLPRMQDAECADITFETDMLSHGLKLLSEKKQPRSEEEVAEIIGNVFSIISKIRSLSIDSDDVQAGIMAIYRLIQEKKAEAFKLVFAQVALLNRIATPERALKVIDDMESVVSDELVQKLKMKFIKGNEAHKNPTIAQEGAKVHEAKHEQHEQHEKKTETVAA